MAYRLLHQNDSPGFGTPENPPRYSGELALPLHLCILWNLTTHCYFNRLILYISICSTLNGVRWISILPFGSSEPSDLVHTLCLQRQPKLNSTKLKDAEGAISTQAARI